MYCRALGVQYRLPFDAGGEGCATAAAQTRGGHFVDNRLRGECQCFFQTLETAVGAVSVERQRIDDASPSKGQPLLIFQVGDRLGQPLAQRMRLRALQQAGIQQCGQIVLGNRPVGDSTLVGRNLDQRLEPEQATGAVADDLQRLAAGLRLHF